MPIRLIEEDERLTFVYEDAKLFYRRMPHDKKATLLQRCTEVKKRVEVTDNAKFMREMLKRTVTGWEGFVDSSGDPVPFTHDALMMVPETVVSAFVDHMDEEGNEEDEYHRKN